MDVDSSGDGIVIDVPSFGSHNSGEILRAAIIHYRLKSLLLYVWIEWIIMVWFTEMVAGGSLGGVGWRLKTSRSFLGGDHLSPKLVLTGALPSLASHSPEFHPFGIPSLPSGASVLPL